MKSSFAIMLLIATVQAQFPVISQANFRQILDFQRLSSLQTPTNSLFKSNVPPVPTHILQQQKEAFQKNAQLTAQKLMKEYATNNLNSVPNFNPNRNTTTPQIPRQLFNLFPFQGFPIVCPVACICGNKAGVCSSCKDQTKTVQSNCTACRAPLILKNNTCQNPECPQQCECAGRVKSVCTSCSDQNAILKTNCSQCKLGYRKVAGVCRIVNQNCPVTCNCQQQPNVCSTCLDPNMSPETLCVKCKQNFIMNQFGVCIASCPKNCLCKGTIPNICTQCKDPKKDLSSNCDQCNPGYTLRARDNSCQAIPCPSYCSCRGINPSVCTICKDSSADLSTNCTTCKPGFLKSRNQSCTAGICSPACSCLGANPTICTTCKDSNKSLSSNCMACIEGFSLNPLTGVCEKEVSNCPENCLCNQSGVCLACKLPNRLPVLSCIYCAPGYNMVAGNCVKGCFGGCKCEQQDPTVCSSCVDSQKSPQTFCICAVGQTYKYRTNTCSS